MSKIKPLLMVAVAIAGVSMVSADCLAQDCNSCGQSQVGTFGYPSPVYGSVVDGNGRGIGSGGHMDEFKARWAHTQEISAKVVARNQAWPKPFNCASRQLYFSMWEQMIDQGFEEQCVLSSSHFNQETNELNSFGNHAVAGIMQNMPTVRRKVFIHQDVNESVNQARMQTVQNTINTFYGNSGPADVAFSNKTPVTLRGTTAEGIFKLSGENQPTPVIAISSGETVGSAVGN